MAVGASTANGAVMVQWTTPACRPTVAIDPDECRRRLVAPPTVGGVRHGECGFRASELEHEFSNRPRRVTPKVAQHKPAAGRMKHGARPDQHDVHRRSPTSRSLTTSSKRWTFVERFGELRASQRHPDARPGATGALSVRGKHHGRIGQRQPSSASTVLPRFRLESMARALDLDGASQYTMVSANILASVTNFTIACWVNWDGGSVATYL